MTLAGRIIGRTMENYMKDYNRNDQYVAVIGAANIDIGGTPSKPLIPADSNPGEISITYGGVGRNIAHNLAKLGVPVKLITAVGGDVLGADMLRSCESVGMDVSNVLRIPDRTSSMYLYINNSSGDMEMAIDHMSIADQITPEYLDSVRHVIQGAMAVVADANISADAFIHLKSLCRAPLYVDPVSTVLASKIKPALEGIDTLKPNRLEAEYLTGMTIQTEADFRAAADAILNMGVRRVFLSMGSEGMLAADKNNMYIVGEYPADVVCTTGAGDSATAAIVWASTVVADRDSLVTAAKAANVVAAMTVGVQETNNPALTHSAVLDVIVNSNMTVRSL